uniref:Odorant receptor n=1 Tax=Heortia vitessoides TaxID=1557813 RepID=A0A3G6V6U8_9NEOP|nr:olfactory receptor 11 [Heortia vitessoides]
MLNVLKRLENPKRPLLGPNVKALKFWGLILPKSVVKKNIYLILHFLITFFVLTECIDIWFIKSDLQFLLTNLKITMLATISIIKVYTFISWRNSWSSIMDYVTKADIAQRNTDDSNKIKKIANVTTYCRKITYSYWILMYTTVVIVIFQPIFKYFFSPIYRENVKNGDGTYLQVISSWVPFDKNKLPGYLAASVYQTYASIYGGGWITAFDSNAIVIMVFFNTELELLRMDCANIFGTIDAPVSDEIAKERIKDCHRRHVDLVKYSRLFDSCLSSIMLLYMFVCTVMLCVTGFQITSETSAMQQFLTAEYLIFGIAQLFIYCWHSNNVFYASLLLNLGPYESLWWSRAVSHRKSLYILTAQLDKEIVFSAGPFTKLTVATFINILKGAYSYYTILSKSQMK